MKKCKECGGLNPNSEYFCDYCSHPLPKEKIFTVKEFLQENSQLFTILGVFGALSYYLSTFFFKQIQPDSTTAYGNLSLNLKIPTEFNPLNSTLSGQELISKSHFNFLSPELVVAYSLFTSFFVFIVVLILINKELLTYLPNNMRHIVWFPLISLLAISFLYVFYLFIMNTFLFFLLITALTIYIISKKYFDFHKYLVEKLKDDPYLSKYTLSGPVVILGSLIIATLLIVMMSVLITSIGKNLIFSDVLIDQLIRVGLIAIIYGILIGFMLTGPGIYTWLTFNRVLKWGISDGKIILFGFFCILCYFIIPFTSIQILKEYAFIPLMIGLIAIVNVYIPKIMTYYSIKF